MFKKIQCLNWKKGLENNDNLDILIKYVVDAGFNDYVRFTRLMMMMMMMMMMCVCVCVCVCACACVCVSVSVGGLGGEVHN